MNLWFQRLNNYGCDGEHEQRQIVERIKAFIEKLLEEADLLLLNQGDRKIYKMHDTLFNGKQCPPHLTSSCLRLPMIEDNVLLA